MADFAGYKVTNLREGKGWDQRTLAARSGLSKSVVSSLESGQSTNPRPRTVQALAEALECDPRYLYKRGRARRPVVITPAPEKLEMPAAEQPAPLFDIPAGDDAPTRYMTPAHLDYLLHNLPSRWRALFDGCQEAGFTETQAMQLLNTAIHAGVLPA